MHVPGVHASREEEVRARACVPREHVWCWVELPRPSSTAPATHPWVGAREPPLLAGSQSAAAHAAHPHQLSGQRHLHPPHFWPSVCPRRAAPFGADMDTLDTSCTRTLWTPAQHTDYARHTHPHTTHPSHTLTHTIHTTQHTIQSSNQDGWFREGFGRSNW